MPGPLRLPRLNPSRHVSCTNPCTNQLSGQLVPVGQHDRLIPTQRAREHLIRRSGHIVPGPSVAVRVLGRHSRVVRTGQALSSGLATVLATVAAFAVLVPTVRFSGRTYPQFAAQRMVSMGAADRRRLPLVAAVAVTIAVSRGWENGCPHRAAERPASGPAGSDRARLACL